MAREESAPMEMPVGKGTNPTAYNSIATMTDGEIVSSHNQQFDPLAGAGRASNNNVLQMSGVANPAFAGFGIGDRIYHKERKAEGKVIDMAASGKIKVALDNGKTGWMNKDLLVKL